LLTSAPLPSGPAPAMKNCLAPKPLATFSAATPPMSSCPPVEIVALPVPSAPKLATRTAPASMKVWPVNALAVGSVTVPPPVLRMTPPPVIGFAKVNASLRLKTSVELTLTVPPPSVPLVPPSPTWSVPDWMSVRPV
jgi:hypothetical protein